MIYIDGVKRANFREISTVDCEVEYEERDVTIFPAMDYLPGFYDPSVPTWNLHAYVMSCDLNFPYSTYRAVYQGLMSGVGE